MLYRKRQQLIKISILLGFCLTLLLAVYPDQLLRAIGFSSTGSTDYAVRLFSLINAAVLALFASTGTIRLVSDRAPRPMTRLPTLPVLTVGAQEAYRSIIIHTHFPSFGDQAAVLGHVASAVILANYKPIHVGSLNDFQLAHKTAVGLVVDQAIFDDALPIAKNAGVTLYTVEPGHAFKQSRLGPRVKLQIGQDMDLFSNLFATALPLAHAHAPDVVRSVGFHGTWVTTYGVLAIRGSADGRATGVYWYGKGEIDGKIEVDQPEGAIVMRFEWSQAHNDSETGSGSASDGRGVLVLAAGYEAFFGYWYLAGNPASTQLWSGTRLSHDIVTSILQGGAFAKDFGLSQHPLKEIVDPGTVDDHAPKEILAS
jgi:hypothetical protein